jgi:hypothetical protein
MGVCTGEREYDPEELVAGVMVLLMPGPCGIMRIPQELSGRFISPAG